MKEFDNNEEYMNNNTDDSPEIPENPKTEENVGVQPENEEVQAQATDTPDNYVPQPENHAQINENGYYYQQQRPEDDYARYNSPYGGANPYSAPSYNAPQYNGYNQNNGYGNGGGYNYQNEQYNQGYNPYQPHSDYRNGYADPYAGYNNSYAPNYNSPQQNGGNISYTPKVKKEKKTKSVSRTVLILTCCITIALSGFVSFLGTSFANRIAQRNAIEQGKVNSGNVSENTSGDSPVVIYKTPEKVDTSVDKADGEILSYADVAAAVKDSVVEITTEYKVQSYYQRVTTGAGSGVIISEQGHIITNNHVISHDETGKIADSIKVRLTDGTEYVATVVGADEISDIAVLKIEAEKLTVAVCGNSDNLAVGEELIIVGNPLGSLGGTVTNGIVSATERTIQVNSIDMTLIQTNAAVNPGNSGGGMFNMMGQLVGIVNAKSSGTGIEGLGFAIPVNEALRVTEQLIEHGYVLGRPDIGVLFSQSSYDSIIIPGFYGVMGGIYVSYVEEGYNDNVLKVGDRVIAINGKEISSVSDIKNIVSASSVGDVLEFQVYRKGYSINLDVVCYEKVPEDVKNNVQFDTGDDANPTGIEIFGHKEGGELIPIN